MPRNDKVALQRALQWYGHYSGSLDGSFGAGTRAAMAAWQSATGYAATGVLTSLQRDVLIASYQSDQASFGFETVQDPEAGLEIALPMQWLEFDRYDPPFVRYSAKDGLGGQLWLISELGDASTLANLYDQLQGLDLIPAVGPRALTSEGFTLLGEGETGGAFAMAEARKGTVKGFALIWPAAQSAKAKRAVEIMRPSFRSTSDQVLDPGLIPLDETLRQGVIAAMHPAQPSSVMSGVYIAQSGLVLTAAQGLGSCGRITIDGATEAALDSIDAAIGAAVLRPQTPVAPLAVANLAKAPTAGPDILLAGYSLPSGLPAPVLTQGEVISQTSPSGAAGELLVLANVTPHDIGGPVLDMTTGALIGFLRGAQDGAKTLPKGTALVQTNLDAFLAKAMGGAAPPSAALTGAPITPDALSAAAMGMTVQVACWP